jgi:hypothetical protein
VLDDDPLVQSTVDAEGNVEVARWDQGAVGWKNKI